MEERPVHLTVSLPAGSVILPAWMVFCFVGAFVLAALAALGMWEANRQLVGEVRVLQLYVEDVQNVLIRQGLGSRADFAPRSAQGEKK